MDFSKDWRDYIIWFLMAAIAVLVVPTLLSYADGTLAGNQYSIVVKVGAVSIIFFIVANFVRYKIMKKGN